MHEKLQPVREAVIARNPGEKEFIQAPPDLVGRA